MARNRRSHQILMAALLGAVACSAEPKLATDPEGPAGDVELLVAGGNTQSGPALRELPNPLKVRVVDNRGRPVTGQVVNFRVTGGGGSTYAGVAVTNEQGFAQERWTIGPPGPQSLEARAVDPRSGASLSFGVFTAVAVAGAPAQLSVLGGAGQATTVGTTLPVAPSVRLTDQNGFPVPGKPVAFAIQSGSGLLSGASVTTDDNGIATLGAWEVDGAGANTVEARVAGLPAAVLSATGLDLAFSLETGMPGNNNTNSVLAFSTTDLWLGGGVGITDHWDGSVWTAYPNPMGANVYSVCGSSPSSLFATGQWGIIRFDGAAWQSLLSTGTEEIGCWSRSPSDLWVVGDGDLRQFNGTSWTDISTGLSRAFNVDRLESVWGDGAGVVYAVGRPGVLRYNGSTVAISGIQNTLGGVHGSSPNDVWAVGRDGVILHFNGTQWAQMASGTNAHLYGVYAFSPRNVYAAGDGGVVLRYDGVRWYQVSTGTTLNLARVSGLSPTSLYVGTWATEPAMLRGSR